LKEHENGRATNATANACRVGHVGTENESGTESGIRTGAEIRTTIEKISEGEIENRSI